MFSTDFFGKLFGRGSSVGRLIAMAALGGVIVAAIAVPAVGALGIVIRNGANKFESLSTKAIGEVPQRSEILDSQGHLIAYVYQVDESYYYSAKNIQPVTGDGIDRSPVSYSQISPTMRSAIVAIEDDRYWEHGAIDFRGTMRALVNDIEHKPVQGGSTIAQQYVKNVLILTAKDPQAAEEATSETLSRKIHELRLAIEVEHKMSRADILASYLNDAYFGYPIVGVETAAETYFGTTAAKLDLADSADLAGMVENPAAYDPVTNPATSLERRNTVLARMAQLGMITKATAEATEKQPIGTHVHTPQNGCTSASARSEPFFCDYVIQSLLRDSALGKTPADRAHLLATGGLTIRTTLDAQDQRAANNASNYWLPAGGVWNPNGLADADVLVQPGTGRIRAISEDRQYGSGKHRTTIDYAATTPYDGGVGVQTGSSSKLFTLITALEQGIPFGFSLKVPNTTTVTPYYTCNGQYAGSFPVTNASTGDAGTRTLYTGTALSVNTFYAELEQKVGLCNVVQTAMRMGMTWGNGTSLMKPYGQQPPADSLPSFTLGAANVAPISMAAAYATVASNGIYCKPVAVQSIVTDAGKKLAAPSAGCHRVLPTDVAEAANYVLGGPLTSIGTASNRGIGRPADAKTGTAGSAGGAPPSAAFAGYTPTLTGYVWVGDPSKYLEMTGYTACYRDNCPNAGSMFGDDAPGAIWQTTFLHAALGPPLNFIQLPLDSPFYSQGGGQSTPQQSKSGGGGNGGNTGTSPGGTSPSPGDGHHGNGGGGGHCLKRLPICLGTN